VTLGELTLGELTLGELTLGELIDTLSRCNPATHVLLGFGNPHSYRGCYEELAFEPVEDTTVGAMLACATEALGSTYQGYKGGDFTMTAYTSVWLAQEGTYGEGIGPVLIAYMTGTLGVATPVTPRMTTNSPRFTAVPDQTEPGRKVLCRIVDWDCGNEDAPATEGNHRVLIDGLTPREAIVGAHLLDDMVRHLGYEPTPEMIDALVQFRFPDKARKHDDHDDGELGPCKVKRAGARVLPDHLCAQETRAPQSHVTSLCRLTKGHEGACQA